MVGEEYSNDEVLQAAQALEQQNKDLQMKNQELSQSMVSSNFAGEGEETLIHYQLETDKILERIEHFLKGDQVTVDATGNVFYKTPKDEKIRNFNEYGVAELMRIISMYVTKETFLSNYTEDRINEIIGDLGDAMANFIYCNYEQMGMNTKFKESKYIMIVLNILHTIESCYRRALGGNEQENIRTRAIVTQNTSPGMMPGMGMGGQQRRPKWNPFKTSTW